MNFPFQTHTIGNFDPLQNQLNQLMCFPQQRSLLPQLPSLIPNTSPPFYPFQTLPLTQTTPHIQNQFFLSNYNQPFTNLNCILPSYMAQQQQINILQQQLQQQQLLNIQTYNSISNRTIQLGELNKSEDNDEKIEFKFKETKDCDVSDPQNCWLNHAQTLEEIQYFLNYLTQQDKLCKDEGFNRYVEQKLKRCTQIDSRIPILILSRFQGQKKTKEEQIKFILRKCFKFLKNSLELSDITMSQFEIEKKFYEHFFCSDEEQFAEEIIPFRSNSKLKTMNQKYLVKIFKSDEFYQGYNQFLDKFDEVWEEENQEKIQNMSKQIIKLIKNDSISAIQHFRRTPWIKSVKDQCKKLAIEMKNYRNISKKIRRNQKRKVSSEQEKQQLKNQNE